MEHSERLDAEGEVAFARFIIGGAADGAADFTHALRHLANALAVDPGLPDAHEALAEVVASVGGAERTLHELDQVEPRDFIGTSAVRAHVLAIAGKWDHAVESLFSVAAADPERPWLDVAWLARPDLPELVRPEVLGISATRLALRLADPVSEDERGPLMPALALLRGSVAWHASNPELLWRASMLARRLGAFDEAVDWADRSFELESSHEAAMTKGYGLRTAGRLDEALETWIEELARTPDDLDLALDVSDLFANMGRLDEALAWTERILAQDPTHDNAIATAHGLRFAIDGKIDHLIALVDEMTVRPYSAAVLARFCHNHEWLNVVDQTWESLTNALTQTLEQLAPDPDAGLTTTVPAIEPPSAVLALRSVFPKSDVRFESAPAPDARLSVEPVTYRVWDYDGMTAVPAVAPPSESAAQAVRQLATVRWTTPLEAYDRAVALSGIDPRDLLGVLVHPPTFPDTEMGQYLSTNAPHLWIRAVQVWACLGLAHHQTDVPWATSTRRSILVDLLRGPEDWVAEAAAFALVVTAWVDPSAREDVTTLVVFRFFAAIEAYQQREVTILPPLARITLLLPDLVDEVARLAREIVHRTR